MPPPPSPVPLAATVAGKGPRSHPRASASSGPIPAAPSSPAKYAAVAPDKNAGTTQNCPIKRFATARETPRSAPGANTNAKSGECANATAASANGRE